MLSSNDRTSEEPSAAPMKGDTINARGWEARASCTARAISADVPDPDSPYTTNGRGVSLVRYVAIRRR